MNLIIIIPAHNESKYIATTLESLVKQSLLPNKIIVVDDHSTDNTAEIVDTFVKKYSFIQLIKTQSNPNHLPGSKVVEAFYKGFETITEEFDIVCKFDADLIFPSNYLETIVNHFKADLKIGIQGGLLYIKKNNTWQYENISDKNHVRGPIKAYRKNCFNAIGGLKKSIGWDTVDTLLAQYHQFETSVDKSLIVRHLKPTGATYSQKSKQQQGLAMYKMRYGFVITSIAALKLSLSQRSFKLFIDYLKGYWNGKKAQIPFIVTKDEGKFIRQLRWKRILAKLF